MVFKQLHTQWQLLADAITPLSDADYQAIHPQLNASLGQHTRHVIEILQCVLTGLDTGIVDYVNRQRDLDIEKNKTYALHLLNTLPISLPRVDRLLALCISLQNEELHTVSTTYFREVVYNTEHVVHHLALMRIALESLAAPLPEAFGVAESTLQYRTTVNG
jgi:hypothetical protein